ncbi:MAG: leucine-rich repeat protein [Clostridia bacterium]|nr:leucine-rich repeat protein [Clostridia bacterium]
MKFKPVKKKNCILFMRDGKAVFSAYADETVQFDRHIEAVPADAYENNEKIKAILLHDGIKMVGANAFRNCAIVSFVVLGKGLELIENGAFTGLPSLSLVLYNGTAEEFEKVLRGEPFETLGKIICTDDVYYTANGTLPLFSDIENTETPPDDEFFSTGAFSLSDGCAEVHQRFHSPEINCSKPSRKEKKSFTKAGETVDGYVSNKSLICTIHIKSSLNTEENIRDLKRFFFLQDPRLTVLVETLPDTWK